MGTWLGGGGTGREMELFFAILTDSTPGETIAGLGVIDALGNPVAENLGEGVTPAFGKEVAEDLGAGVTPAFGKEVAEDLGAGVFPDTAGPDSGRDACGEFGIVNSSSKGNVMEGPLAGVGGSSAAVGGLDSAARFFGGGGGGGGGDDGGRRIASSRAMTETSRAGFHPVIPSFHT